MKPMSKPLLAILLLTLVASIVTALMPAPLDTAAQSAGDLLAEERLAPVSEGDAGNRFLRPVSHERGSTPVGGFVAATPIVVTPVVVEAPPPPPPPPQPDPVPTPPFAYLGQLEEGQRTVWFLQAGEDALAVVPGEKVNSQWQFDSAQDDMLVFRHLPSQQTQTLRISP